MKKALFIFFTLAGLLSCDKSPVYDYQVVDSDIIIKMNEELSSTARSFELSLLTDSAYPCVNYSLITNSSATTTKITVDILGVYTPDICATAIGPATSVIPFSNIQNKSYDIEFKIGSNISKGKLVCTAGEFSLQMDDLLQIKIDGPVLKRIPDNIIWGTVGYHNSSTIDKVNEFLASLKAAGAKDVSLDNGNYNYFAIENGTVVEPTNMGYYFTKSFVYSYTGDKNLIREIVKDYGKNYTSSMSIRVYGDKGEEYLGWMLRLE
jgi:hypothetical protein